MAEEIKVKCTIKSSFGEEEFTMQTMEQTDLTHAKPVEVTTIHPDGPLKETLKQLEAVQLQSNNHLTTLIAQYQKKSGM